MTVNTTGLILWGDILGYLLFATSFFTVLVSFYWSLSNGDKEDDLFWHNNISTSTSVLNSVAVFFLSLIDLYGNRVSTLSFRKNKCKPIVSFIVAAVFLIRYEPVILLLWCVLILYGCVWLKVAFSKEEISKVETFTGSFDVRDTIGILTQHKIWVGVYFFMNLVLFITTFIKWLYIPNLSMWAPLAKGNGMLLNFNCALIVIPVFRTALDKLNDMRHQTDAWYCRLARKLPLEHNLQFHRLIAVVTAVAVFGHVTGHVLNVKASSISRYATSGAFGIQPWISGPVILFSLFVLFSGTSDQIRRTCYEIFWYSHHVFIVFLGVLFIHAPRFYLWGLGVCVLYTLDRLWRQSIRSLHVPRVVEVTWIDPVMCIRFRSDGFTFKEGQWIYLQCPRISKYEWHPFSVSSACEDPHVTIHVRVAPGGWTAELKAYLELMATERRKGTGGRFTCRLYGRDDEVVRQKRFLSTHLHHVPTLERLVQDDPTVLDELRRLLYIYTKEGKSTGPDGLPLLLLEGPHAAPSQHYDEYPAVLLVGGGIGLTPAASILQAVLRYKWKKTVALGMGVRVPCEVVFFCWVCRQREVRSFTWFAELLVELDAQVEYDLHHKNLQPQNYTEVHVFITGTAEEREGEVEEGEVMENPVMLHMLAPEVVATTFGEVLGGPKRSLVELRQMVWRGKWNSVMVWQGRPRWEQVFLHVQQQTENSNVGVVFCGAPEMGEDVEKMCYKFKFRLHKENF